jgi:multiple sugar transport system permease protein
MDTVTGRSSDAATVLATRHRKGTEFRNFLRTLGSHFLLIPVAVLFAMPFYWMIATALKSDRQVFAWPLVWFPKPLVWQNFPDAMRFFPFWLYLRNTSFIAASTVVGAVISNSLVAYSLACIPWRGRNVMFLIAVGTMMIPYQVVMVPLFITFSHLGWVGTWLPLIVPSYFSGAFFVFLLRQFFRTIPNDLIDAGKIDGASHPRIYAQIILPLAKPALFTVGLFQFLNTWGDFTGPLIYLSDAKMYTISLGLQMFRLQYDTQWQKLMAASVMLTGPIIVLFFFTQRTFIQGITMTGIKG